MVLVTSCKRFTPESEAIVPAEVRIGFAGANVEGNEIGLGQFATFLTEEGLTYSGVDGRPTPQLAERWGWENDGLTLRVVLRPKVTFHDGTPFNAAAATDVLKEAIKRPRTRALYPALADISDVQHQGERDVVITLSQRSAFLPEDLDMALTRGAGAGTGPYKVVKRDKTELVLERYEPYYLGKPLIARVVVRPFDTLRTAWSSLLRGDVDVVSEVPSDAVEFVENEQVKVIPFYRGYQYLMAFNSRRGPFVSPRVRRALNIAVDREPVINKLFRGHASASTGPLWPRHWAYDSSVQPYAYDPRAAMTLLDAAGFPANRLPATSTSGPARIRFRCIIAEGFSIVERLALELQKQLYDVGVDMQFEVLSPEDFDSRIRSEDFEAVLTEIASGPTFERPYLFWRSARTSKGLNVFGYENEESESLFQLLRSSMNEAAVRSATQRLQRVMLDDPPALFVAWSQRIRAVRRDFNVPTTDGDPILTLWRWTADYNRRNTRVSLAQ